MEGDAVSTILGQAETEAHENWLLVFAAIAHGQNETGGFKSRAVPLKGRIARGLGARRKEIHQLATEQIREIDNIDRVLTAAIGIAVRSGVQWSDVPQDQRKKEAERQSGRAKPYRDRLDAVADRAFFDALWARFEATDSESRQAARRAFVLPLIDAARELLDEGLADIPCPSIRRPRAEARARASFESQIRSGRKAKGGDLVGFPDLLSESDKQETPDAA